MTTLATILQLVSFIGIIICMHLYYTDKLNDLKSEFHKYVIESQKYIINKEDNSKIRDIIEEDSI